MSGNLCRCGAYVGIRAAIRQGDWKLVKASAAMQPMLVNLANDRGEQTDLTDYARARCGLLHPDRRHFQR